MKLTILGNNGPFPGPGGACSGYLIENAGTKILVDCGNGVLSNLQRLVKIDELDVIILTHLHSDHMSDMMVLRYAVQIKTNRGQMKNAIRVCAPSEPASEFSRLNLSGIFELEEINENSKLNLGNMEITFKEMLHPVKCFGVCFNDGNKRFVFSGDTAWTNNIIEFGREADLLMLDAGLLTKDKTSDNVPHLTARECGIVARKSGARKLMLTHFWPEYSIDDLLKEARENFEAVQAAEIMKSYEI